jgi:hypothetical protein
MVNDELRNMIDLYFDGELEKNKEPILFTALAVEVDAREYFKNLHVLQALVSESIESFPVELEENILASVKPVKTKSYNYLNFRNRVSHIVSIAAAAILFLVCSLLFLDVNDYKSQISAFTEQLKEQKETIEIIMNNNYPAVVVSPDSKNEIIVRANTRRKI